MIGYLNPANADQAIFGFSIGAMVIFGFMLVNYRSYAIYYRHIIPSRFMRSWFVLLALGSLFGLGKAAIHASLSLPFILGALEVAFAMVCLAYGLDKIVRWMNR